MTDFEMFTGGPLDTNAYYLETGGLGYLFDAPLGAAEHFAGRRIDWLLLTHGHFDHTADGARIKAGHRCRIGFHALTTPMVEDGQFFKRHGFELEIEPFTGDRLLDESSSVNIDGLSMQTFHVPGHCPGSLCFYFPERGELIGGDVLFHGGVGRWDLPGGDGELLFSGIRSKLFPLPDDTVVLPGHGPATTIGFERESNPYVRG